MTLLCDQTYRDLTYHDLSVSFLGISLPCSLLCLTTSSLPFSPLEGRKTRIKTQHRASLSSLLASLMTLHPDCSEGRLVKEVLCTAKTSISECFECDVNDVLGMCSCKRDEERGRRKKKEANILKELV